MRLVLASASPRRRELLGRLGVPFEVIPSGVEEVVPAGLTPAAAARALACAKAREVAARGDPAVVLGADTLVVVDGVALGKPGSRAAARTMLLRLRGRVHEVITAVWVVAAPGGPEADATVVSRVTMRAYTEAEVDAYVATGEPDDKAGAYAVQGEGGRLVAAVEGCYTNVVGLPVGTTARLLRRFGVPAVAPVLTGPEWDPAGSGPR